VYTTRSNTGGSGECPIQARHERHERSFLDCIQRRKTRIGLGLLLKRPLLPYHRVLNTKSPPIGEGRSGLLLSAICTTLADCHSLTMGSAWAIWPTGLAVCRKNFARTETLISATLPHSLKSRLDLIAPCVTLRYHYMQVTDQWLAYGPVLLVRITFRCGLRRDTIRPLCSEAS
jgi:hypothetical protein